ncbi:histidine kinase [Larkinella ripae]
MKECFTLNRYDVLVMLANYPALIFGNYLVLGPAYFTHFSVYIPFSIAETALYVLVAWVMVAWMRIMRNEYRELDQSIRRIIYCLLFYVFVTALFTSTLYGLFAVFNLPGYRFDPVIFRWTLLLGLVTNILSVGILESVYSYQRWRESVEREYGLKQVHMQRQLDSLKQQVNPHFLFNSLNSLTALISENPQQAELFAEELSSVYRYVLRANEQNLTDLDTELAFIQSYYHLLKTRHGAGLTLKLAIDQRFGTYQLPPLTLQMLLENAVKHNVVLAEQPLEIEIQTDEPAFISVRNNLQKKQTRVLSNGVGLSNILTKYQMLGQPVPSIQEINGQFVVRLPLIKARP